ncbi:hypothetical protein A2630_00010 [Candidatus Woesebacteria bacterium RIFCSPHIGHO2_01_FULL_44_10]|uniref:Uncharacterized protein n=1 Tax=Candidatus Woesebacteria bacterium RIFCSPLOWO2_01_FULL_44_14 TaxID=1802525 RepID=A0A1F8BX64_9BACT|nr:MAG: hypothetical protein A2630_00010 [Candidatus Woesebacteria bacterium RIFCSPHIGHO2_01_FULL_44_10]OGM56258.1 MAG: hypothetical protein A3F62_03330 [Candidatus Woesebacteria bacterium RIFCSPHIGHO2_12_FULL_44_11]OGM68694.1 MAG: hypothetical protein A2975_05310 [Candidatus Woesebacteria bacterium RIFCSPLOWO2_01_FULL_44_14]
MAIEFVKVQQPKTDLRKEEPPMVDVKVANPITYLKSWWKKIIGNEGMELRIRIKPLTAIAISLIVVTVAFGIGKFVLPFKIPFFEYSSKYEPSPTPDITYEAGFIGTMRVSGAKYFLFTSASESINLQVPERVDLSKLIGLRVFATGRFNSITNTLLVANAKDLEILAASPSPIPTTTPGPTSSATPEITPTPESTSSASPSPTP